METLITTIFAKVRKPFHEFHAWPYAIWFNICFARAEISGSPTVGLFV